MQVDKYSESKLAGNVIMQRYGDSYQCVKKAFNPETGQEMPPQISTFTEAELLTQKATAERVLNSINEMLADLKSLK